MPKHPTNEERIKLAQLHLYIDNHLLDRFLTPLLTIVVAALLTHWVAPWKAIVWAVLELVIIAVYINMYGRFRRAAPSAEHEPLWRRRIAIIRTVHMMMWSSIIVWALQPENFNNLIFIMLIHVGLISLTAVMSHPHRTLLLSDLFLPAIALVVPPLMHLSWFNAGLSLLTALYAALMTLVGLKIHANTLEALRLRMRNEELIAELEQKATHDALTDVANRRHILQRGTEEIRRAARSTMPLTVMILDIDHFKSINDTLGHQAGDVVIRQVAKACQNMLRTTDRIGRLGGEEFVIIMPDTNRESALQAAERLRSIIGDLDISVHDQNIRITVSIGVTLLLHSDETLPMLLHRADMAMYAAKSEGRNRVVGRFEAL